MLIPNHLSQGVGTQNSRGLDAHGPKPPHMCLDSTMNQSFYHYQITTMNEIGEKRRSKFLELWKELDLAPDYVDSKNRETAYPFFSESFNRQVRGLAGCLNTHRKAWKLFLESEYDLALITEDDAVPSVKIGTEIEKIQSYLANRPLSDLPITIDAIGQFGKPALIQLGWFPFPKVRFRQFIVALYHLVRYKGPVLNGYVRGYVFSTHCYLINREMATFLLDNVSSEGLPMDLQFMTVVNYYPYRECDILRSCQNYATQERLDSSIESEAFWGVGSKDTVISRLLTWVQSLADAKGSRIAI